jgi:TRAP-type C4-dicarboxylate transport system substrate-binding protein
VKKTVFVLLFIALLVSLPLLMSCSSSAPAATGTTPAAPTANSTVSNKPADNKVYEFSYSVFFPPVHKNSILAQKFSDEINKRTNGKVKITVFAGGTLTKADKVYDGVVNGLSDMGMSVVSYTKGRFPASELVELPHGYLNGWVATKVANDYYNEFKPKEFDGVHVLYFHAHGPSVLLTTSKPVRQIEDMKGMVIRSTGIGAAIVESLGGKGYGAAQNEAYDLMSKNTIDGSYTPREVLEGWKQAEIVKYVTECTEVGSTANMYVVINKDKWNSLPADIQDVFTQVSKEWIEKHGMTWTNYDVSAINYFKTFEGRELIKLSSEESAKWIKATEPLTSGFIKDLSAKGLPSDTYEKFLLEKAKAYAGKAPSDQAIIDFNKAEFGK